MLGLLLGTQPPFITPTQHTGVDLFLSFLSSDTCPVLYISLAAGLFLLSAIKYLQSDIVLIVFLPVEM